MRSRILIIVVVIAAAASIALAAGIKIWPQIAGQPNYYIGLPADVYGLHPMDRESYGEGYFFLARMNDGTFTFTNYFVTNIGPGDQKSNIDFSICEPGKECVFAKTEFGKDPFQGATGKMDFRSGNSRAWGSYPNFQMTAAANGLKLDLKYQAQLPGFAINSGKVTFGNDDDFYSNYVLMPRAKVSGTITTAAGSRQVSGYGYTDHGFVTMMPHKYSKRWFSLRCFDEKYTLDILEFTVPPEHGGATVPMIIFGKDNKILYGGTRYTLKPSQWKTDPKFNKQYPARFDFSIDRPGKVKVDGHYTVQKIIEQIDLLKTMSFLERQVARFFASSFVYRFLVQVEATVTLPDGTTETFSAPAVSEVLYVN